MWSSLPVAVAAAAAAAAAVVADSARRRAFAAAAFVGAASRHYHRHAPVIVRSQDYTSTASRATRSSSDTMTSDQCLPKRKRSFYVGHEKGLSPRKNRHSRVPNYGRCGDAVWVLWLVETSRNVVQSSLPVETLRDNPLGIICLPDK